MPRLGSQRLSAGPKCVEKAGSDPQHKHEHFVCKYLDALPKHAGSRIHRIRKETPAARFGDDTMATRRASCSRRVRERKGLASNQIRVPDVIDLR